MRLSKSKSTLTAVVISRRSATSQSTGDVSASQNSSVGLGLSSPSSSSGAAAAAAGRLQQSSTPTNKCQLSKVNDNAKKPPKQARRVGPQQDKLLVHREIAQSHTKEPRRCSSDNVTDTRPASRSQNTRRTTPGNKGPTVSLMMRPKHDASKESQLNSQIPAPATNNDVTIARHKPTSGPSLPR